VKIVEHGVELLWITPEPLRNIELAGRTCYKSEDKITDDSAVKFCQMIYQRGHESVVEHACASFRIVCDRGVSHEIVRHRIASYSQESTRYCNYSKDKFKNEISVILPPGVAPCFEASMVRGECQCDECICYAAWERANIVAQDSYNIMIAKGKSPQIARSVLPTDLKTEMVMTCNFREWMHFIKLRTDPAAHPQIRPIAEAIRVELEKHAPTIFGRKNDTQK
jgi:thymidylate synthase (FAD)